MKKNLHVMILFLLMFVMCMTSCHSNSSRTPSEDSETDDEQAKIKNILLTENGSFRYTVVYPEYSAQVVTDEKERLLSGLDSQTGIRPQEKSDYLKRGAVYDSQAPEILFGRTGYTESETILKGLQEGQFSISLQGEKIVIIAYDDQDLSAAVDYFLNVLLEKNLTCNDNSCILKWEDYQSVSESVSKNITVNGTDIRNFSIVYDSERNGYLEIAQRLRDMVSEILGCTLKIYADKSHPADGSPEILIGKTNRELSQSMYEQDPPGLLTYQLVVREQQMQILCGGPYSARECVDAMRFSVFGSSDNSLENGICCEADMNLPNSFSQGTDLRIMTSNVLAARWGEDYGGSEAEEWGIASTPPVAQRAEIYAAVLASCQPDVVGVQESDQKWIDTLPMYLEILKTDYQLEYTWLFYDFQKKETFTTVLYRSDKYELLESDIFNHSYWNKPLYNLRLHEWVRLREKEDPSHEFILVNTHWAWENEEWTKGSVDAQIEVVNDLKQRYDVPIFCTGDFNCNPTMEEYARFRAETNVQSTREQAIENGVLANNVAGCNGVGVPRNAGGNYIDHIFGYGSYEVLKYETVLGKAIWISDHSPHIADIKLS